MSDIVLDTNVLVSGFARRSPDSAVAQVVDAWRARLYTLVVSGAILAEFERALANPYFSQFATLQQRQTYVGLLRMRAHIIDVTVQVEGVATHPEDDAILATAASAKADYLVTGDKQLQLLRTYSGVAIVSPRAFLAILPDL